jgi:hypothetical protein
MCDGSAMPEPTEGTKAYLEYLDKEMTIMGILSTFCVAAAALVIDRVGSADKSSFFGGLAANHIVQVFVGCGLLMLAGLYFYLQRSVLAHYYGSLCMSMAKPGSHDWNTERWLIEVYSWITWLRYRLGFMFLTLTALVFVAVIDQEIRPCRSHLWVWVELVLFLVIFGVFVLYNVVLSTYRYEDCPRKALRIKTFLADWQHREEYPPKRPRNSR